MPGTWVVLSVEATPPAPSGDTGLAVARFIVNNGALNGTASASSELTGYPASNVTDHNRGSIWIAGASGTQYVTIDCGAPITVTAVGIANHNLNMITGSKQLRASDDNFSSDDNLVETLDPGTALNDVDYFHSFASVTKRYWRVKILGVGGDPVPYIGEVFLGVLVTPTYNPDIGLAEDHVWPAESVSGQTGVRISEASGRKVLRWHLEYDPVSLTDRVILTAVPNWGQGLVNPYFYIPRNDDVAAIYTYGRAFFVRNLNEAMAYRENVTDVWGLALDFEEEQ